MIPTPSQAADPPILVPNTEFEAPLNPLTHSPHVARAQAGRPSSCRLPHHGESCSTPSQRDFAAQSASTSDQSHATVSSNVRANRSGAPRSLQGVQGQPHLRGDGTSCDTAIELDCDLPTQGDTATAAPKNSVGANAEWPKYERIKIVHTCEPESIQSVTRYKVGYWTARTDRPIDAPCQKVSIPKKGLMREEVWRCGKKSCRFCERTAGGYTDLTESVAVSHGITDVPVQGYWSGQTGGVVLERAHGEDANHGRMLALIRSNPPVSIGALPGGPAATSVGDNDKHEEGGQRRPQKSAVASPERQAREVALVRSWQLVEEPSRMLERTARERHQ